MAVPVTFPLQANVAILLFLGMLLSSFGVAGYVLFTSAVLAPARSVATDVPMDELLANAEELLRKQQTEQALVTYRRILTSNPTSVAAQMGLARAESLAGREELAAEEYERALRLDRHNSAALLQLGQIYSHRAKNWRLAEARFEQYLVLRPNDAAAQLQLARVLSWQGKWSEAAEAYSKSALTKLMTIEDQRSYVLALVKSGQIDRAELVVKRLLADGQQDFELKLHLASVYASRQEWNSALPLYRSLLRERPNDSRLNLTYGIGMLSTRDYRAALEPLAKARGKMASSGEAGLAYARALRGAKHYEAADREFERVLPLLGVDTAVVREYADLLLEKRNYRKAEDYYRQAYDMGVRDVRLLVSLSGALRANGKPRAALPYLEEAYKREPTDRLALDLAKLLHELGRHQQALQILSRIEAGSTPSSR
jgi:tetratricopeptide (TPR) repeat protein